MSERGNPVLRFADSVAGPPLLRLFSWLRRSRPRPNRPERIGVMCFGALGDLLLLSSVISDIRKAYPLTEVKVLGSGTNKAIASMLPALDFTELPVKRPDQAIKRLRALKLDVIIDSTQWAKLPALLCASSGAYTVGFRTEGQSRHHAYDCVVTHRNDRHEVDNFRALAEQLVPITGALPQLVLSEDARKKIPTLGLGRYAVLHAWPSGARSEFKEWPTAHWAKLAHHLNKQHRLNVVLTGATLDKPKSAALVKEIGDFPWLHDTTGKLRLPETIALLEQAALNVSVNTGILHMAACFDVPLIGLSGPTNPLRWGPLSDRAANPKPSCAGCWYLNLGFEYPDNPPDCMGAISAHAVIAAADEML